MVSKALEISIETVTVLFAGFFSLNPSAMACDRGRRADAGDLHANYVRRSINSRLNSNVLRRASPPVHSSDIRLPRAHRSVLAQLRSGYCSAMNNYLARITQLIFVQSISGEREKTVKGPAETPYLQERTRNLGVGIAGNQPGTTSV